jgi:hypothetical protein
MKVTVMAEKNETEDFDFSEVQATAVQRLKARKIVPVPASVVKKAQESYDGVPGPDGQTLHVLEFKLDTVERAEKFAYYLRNAGDHTQPVTSVTALVNPDSKPGEETLVRWRAGARRGRTTS